VRILRGSIVPGEGREACEERAAFNQVFTLSTCAARSTNAAREIVNFDMTSRRQRARVATVRAVLTHDRARREPRWDSTRAIPRLGLRFAGGLPSRGGDR